MPSNLLNVLIVEDSASDLELAIYLLRKSGFEPAWRNVQGRADYARSLDDPPDIILADYTLPDFNALDALGLMHERDLDIPFIIVSGTISEEVAVECMKRGAADYLLKDRLSRLGPAVAQALEKKRLRDEKNAAQKQAERDIQDLLEHLRRSNRELAAAYDATLEGWVRFLDLRDHATEGHTQRVAALTLALADRIGYTEGERIHLRRGALLHDIGKMGIPDSILQKPGPLNEDEWTIMRQHPDYAHAILAPIDFLQPALDIPKHHHEKWDGSGYPDHLSGDEIPLAARLFAIADVWDALKSDRPYRPAWPEEKVVQYLEAESGRHFDPDYVPLFLEYVASR